MDLSAFAKIAPYLSHPLPLVGFVLLLFFGIHRLLIKSGRIPPVPRTQAPQIVKLFLTYGFTAAILVILAGFGLQAYETHVEAAANAEPATIQQETQGSGSPAVADTDGNVTITIEQPAPADAPSQ